MSPFSQSLFRTRSLFQRVFSCTILLRWSGFLPCFQWCLSSIHPSENESFEVCQQVVRKLEKWVSINVDPEVPLFKPAFPFPQGAKKAGKICKFCKMFAIFKFCKFLAGSFSAVSKRNFARKYAFDSIFQALQDLHTFTPLQSQYFSKNADWKISNFRKTQQTIANVVKSTNFNQFLPKFQNFG